MGPSHDDGVSSIAIDVISYRSCPFAVNNTATLGVLLEVKEMTSSIPK